MLDSAIFWIFSVVGVGAALSAVFTRNSVYAALSLIATFMSIAGFYLLNNADFLAIAQIILYAVGLTILMLFAIMLTGDSPADIRKVNRTSRLAYGIIIAYVFVLVLRSVLNAPIAQSPMIPFSTAERLIKEGSATLLGQSLFSTYALPFELASILLLAAMIGAIVIAKKRFIDSESDMLGEMRLALDMSSAPSEEAIEALRRKRELEHQERQSTIQPDSAPPALPIDSPEQSGNQAVDTVAASTRT